jgi:hypothetical protein
MQHCQPSPKESPVHRSRLISILFALIAATLTPWSGAGAAGPSSGADAPVVCSANVMHPIRVRVTALDPIRRGAELRLQVTAIAARELGNVQVRMLSDGGAPRRSPALASLGNLPRGRQASAVFRVAVPQSGSRFYVQFQVEGEAAHGRLTRGACFNILPDGPLETARIVDTPEGARVREVAARRID